MMGERIEPAEPDFAEALQEHDDLVQRFADGDVHALDSLIESVTGVRIVESRTITRRALAGDFRNEHVLGHVRGNCHLSAPSFCART